MRDPHEAVAPGGFRQRNTAREDWAWRVLPPLVGLATVILAVLVGRNPTSPDDALYRALATSLAAGRGYVDAGWLPFTVRPPGFPAELAAMYEVVAPGSRIPWLVQAFVAGVTLALFVALVQRWAGWLAAALVVTAAYLVPGVREVALSLRSDLLASLALVVGAALTYVGITARRPPALLVGAVFLGASVLAKETMLVYVVLPLCLWAVLRPDRSLLPAALGASLAAAGLAWAWWVWVAFSRGQAFPTEASGPLAVAAVVASMPVALALAAALVQRRPRSRFPATAAEGRPRLVIVGLGLAVLGIAVVAIVVAGAGAQQAAVGDIMAGLVRFVRDKIVGEIRWLVPLLVVGGVLGLAWWRAGGDGVRTLVVIVALSAPVWFLTAEGARSLRSVAVPLLALVALGGWAIETAIRRGLARPGGRPLPVREWAMLAVLVLATVTLAVLPTRAAAADPEPQDWSSADVVRAAALVDRMAARNNTVVVSWLYGNEVYARTRGAYRMPYVPTLLFRTTGAELHPVSTLYRFSPLAETEKSQRLGELVWLRYVPSLRGYMGLSLPALLALLSAPNARGLLVAGDSFQSTLDIVPVLDSLPALRRIGAFGAGRNGIVVYEKDPLTTVAVTPPPAWPLFLNGPTLQQLVGDLREAGLSEPLIALAVQAARVRLVEPNVAQDAALLARLAALAPTP